ncbi:coxsackievirus and adenovirus receptor homolog isoform X1 [Petromyzon marinus]|uniref:coxsackievirus and adenovirus receptor homolog isoform X1 n=1 Tax=Petromyzon marinus TaxID=7757 RepID=UPI003F70DD85
MAAMAVSRSALLLPLLLPLLLLQVTAIAMSAVSWMEKVQGETVVLGCTWTGDPTDTEVLDVEWFLQMPTTNIYVATFAGGEGHIYPDFASRVRFARNATRRDASLQIAGLRASDAGVYTCKVKFGTFIKLETIRLTVLVKPSQPSCVVNGSLQQGEELSLQCLSTEGTSPIRYRWSKAGGEEGPSPSVLGGTLRISNASESHAETYRCNASNRVGWRSCVVTLSLVSPSANAGVVTGAVMGVLLLLVVVAAIGFLVLYPLLKRKAAWDRDYRHNDIRIDDCPPVSMCRPPTPATRDPPGTGTSVGLPAPAPPDGLPALRRALGGSPHGRAEGRAGAGASSGARGGESGP